MVAMTSESEVIRPMPDPPPDSLLIGID